MATTTGFEHLDRKLNELEHLDRGLRNAMSWSLKLIQDDLSEQFPKKKGAFSALATPGQKRAYWARVRSGEIDHHPQFGYKRTGSTKAWTTDVEQIPNGIRGSVGNVKEHMRFVQGDWQQPFHKATGWRTTEQTIERKHDKITDRFRGYVVKVLRK